MKKLNKKLSLDRETLVPLVRDDLVTVAGGNGHGTVGGTATVNGTATTVVSAATTQLTTTLTTHLSRGLGCPRPQTR